MGFHLIEQTEWKRAPYFQHYLHQSCCAYSMTVNIDITNLLTELKQRQLKFHPTIVYLVALLFNQHQEFRMGYDKDKRVGYWDVIHPCHLIFHQDDETFSNLWTEYTDNFAVFYQRFLQDCQQYQNQKGFSPKAPIPENSFPFSVIPWTSFTGFHLHLYQDGTYLTPISTIGKYYQERHQIILPYSLQVHHAVCDGFHISRFFNELQDLCNHSRSWLNYHQI